jgi:hypothetical protein
MERQFKKVDRNVSEPIRALRHEFREESGVVSRMLRALLGPVLLWTTRREGWCGERRMNRRRFWSEVTG